MSKKILNFLFLIPFLAILSTVFVIYGGLMNGIVSGKYYWFFCSIAAASITLIASVILNRRQISLKPIDLLALVFSASGMLASYIHSGINTKLVLLILISILYFYFRIFINQYKWNTYVLVLFFILTGLIEAVWGLMQLYGLAFSHHALFRTTGSFFNSGPYAGYLAMIFPAALHYILKDYPVFKRKFNKIYLATYTRWIISLLAGISIILALPATMSRAAWLATIGGSCIVLLFYFLNKSNFIDYYRKHKKKIIAVFVVLIVFLFIGGIGMYNMKKDSANGRFLIWKISCQVIKEHPLGVGLGNFGGSYGEKQAEYFESGKGTMQEEYIAGNPEYAFNEYLQICIELGVVPFILFLSIIISAIASGIKNKKYMAVSSLIALLIFAGMSYPFNILPFAICLVFLLALCISKEISGKETNSGKSNTILLFSFLIISITIITACLIERYPIYKAYKSWNNSRLLYQMNLYSDAMEGYKNNEMHLSDQTEFLFEYAQCLSKTGQYEASNEILDKATKISCDPMLYNIKGINLQAMKKYDGAEENFRKAANIVPNRHYSYYLLAKMYKEKGEHTKAKKTARYVIEKEPKVPSRAIDRMKEEMKSLLDSSK